MFFLTLSPSLTLSLSLSLTFSRCLSLSLWFSYHSLSLSDLLITLFLSLCSPFVFVLPCVSPPPHSQPLSLSLSFCLARAGCKKILSLLHYPHKIKFIYSFVHSVSHIRSLSLCVTLSLSFSVSLWHTRACAHTHTHSLCVSLLLRSFVLPCVPPPPPHPPISYCLTYSFSLCDFLSFSVCLSLMHARTQY